MYSADPSHMVDALHATNEWEWSYVEFMVINDGMNYGLFICSEGFKCASKLMCWVLVLLLEWLCSLTVLNGWLVSERRRNCMQETHEAHQRLQHKLPLLTYLIYRQKLIVTQYKVLSTFSRISCLSEPL